MRSTKQLLGMRIKELRKTRKLSQEELAERIGVEPQHISRLEAGRSFPSLDRLDKIASALDVPLKEFFEFSHLGGAAERLKKIDEMAKGLSEERQRFAYRMLKALQEL